MKKIESQQVLKMHSMLIERIGGRDGVRDLSVLKSALEAPFQTFLGEDLYLTIEQKAARLCYGLIKNHAFHDGNKRIGVLTLLTFLEINEIKVEFNDEELIDIGISIATDKMSLEALTDKINQHKKISKENIQEMN